MIRNIFKEIFRDIIVVWVGLPIAVFAAALIFAALRVAAFPELLQLLIPTILLTIFIVILVVARFNGAFNTFPTFTGRERVKHPDNLPFDIQPAIKDISKRRRMPPSNAGNQGFELTSRIIYIRIDNKGIDLDLNIKLVTMRFQLGWRTAVTTAAVVVALIKFYPSLMYLLSLLK